MPIDVSLVRNLPLFRQMDPASLSRLMSAWEGQGLVAGGRQKLTVTDAEGLARIADPDL